MKNCKDCNKSLEECSCIEDTVNVIRSTHTLDITDMQDAKCYQIMIINEEGEKIAFKQDDKWTINASSEEILDVILKVMKPSVKIADEFAIEFFNWATSYKSNDRNNWQLSTKELLEIYKKEK